MMLPFETRPKTEIKKVGNDQVGNLWLMSRGDVAVDESPPSLQKRIDQRIEFELVMKLIAEKIQKAYPTAPIKACLAKALKMQVFVDKDLDQVTLAKEYKPGDETIQLTKDSPVLFSNDWLSFGDSGILIVTRVIKDKNANYQVLPIGQGLKTKTKGTRIDIDISEYADTDTIKQAARLNRLSPDTAIEAATLMIRYRVLYPVRITRKVKSGEGSIVLNQLNTSLQENDRIKFLVEGDRPVTVTVAKGIAVSDDGVFDIGVQIENCPGGIPADTLGFLMDGPTYKAGAKWTEDQTRKLGGLASELYQFYQEESLGPQPDKDSTDDGVGNGETSNNSSDKSENVNQLTGVNTSGESSPTGSQTPDSTPKILEAAHAA